MRKTLTTKYAKHAKKDKYGRKRGYHELTRMSTNEENVGKGNLATEEDEGEMRKRWEILNFEF